MVEAVRRGRSQQQVARDFDVSPATVNRWVHHAHGQRLDRVDWSSSSPIPHTTRWTDPALEDLVLEVRSRLRAESDLGFFAAEAILESLQARGVEPLPAERNIYRILCRRGVLDGRTRVRRPRPPPGWYLPEVARRGRELDSFDIVEGSVIRGGPQVQVLLGPRADPCGGGLGCRPDPVLSVRRREPADQPFIKGMVHRIRPKPFHE
jgi:hypothetical protein